jgi:hypothetical protein
MQRSSKFWRTPPKPQSSDQSWKDSENSEEPDDDPERHKLRMHLCVFIAAGGLFATGWFLILRSFLTLWRVMSDSCFTCRSVLAWMPDGQIVLARIAREIRRSVYESVWT